MNRFTFSLLVTMFVARLLAACAPPSPTFQQTSGMETPTYTPSSEAARVANLQRDNARLIRRIEALERGQRRGDGEETVGQALSRRDRGSYAVSNGGGPTVLGGDAPGYGVRVPITAPIGNVGWIGPTPWAQDSAQMGGSELRVWFNMDPSEQRLAARIFLNGSELPVANGVRTLPDGRTEPFFPRGQASNGERPYLVPPSEVYGGARVHIALPMAGAETTVRVEFWSCNSMTGICRHDTRARQRTCTYHLPEGHAETEISVTVGGFANTCNG